MRRFETRKIRETDANGKLVKAGFEWPEDAPIAHFFGGVLEIVGGIGLVLAVLLMGSPSVAAPLGLLSTFITVAGIAASLGARKQRSIIFHTQGEIEAPSGLPGFRSHRKVGGNHWMVVSIEHARMPDQTYVVRILSSGGDTVWLAENLTEAESLKVAVQLTLALTELRDATVRRQGNIAVNTVRPTLVN